MILDPCRCSRRFALAGAAILLAAGSLHADVVDPAAGRWSAQAPPSAYGHQLFVDGARGRLVLFNSNDVDGRSRTELWIGGLDGTNWRMIPDSGDVAPLLSTAVLDPAGDRLIALSYDGALGLRTRVFALDAGDTWTLLPAANPPPARSDFSVAWDSRRQRLLMFGGSYSSHSGEVLQGDLWALNLGGAPAWSQIVLPGGPAARRSALAVYDPVHDRLILRNGETYNAVGLLETWQLSFATNTWSQIPVGEWLPYTQSAMAYDSLGDRLLVFEDPYVSGPPDDVDVWRLAWADTLFRSFNPAGVPPVDRGYALGIDSRTGRVYVHGGYPGLNGLSVFDASFARRSVKVPPPLVPRPPSAWGTILPPTPSPSPRYASATMFDAAGERLVLSGGGPSYDVADGPWALGFRSGGAWDDLRSLGLPSAGTGGALANLYPSPDWIQIPGDRGSSSYPHEFTRVSSTVGPSIVTAPLPDSLFPRVREAVVSPPSSLALFLFGGRGQVVRFGTTQTYFLNDLWEFDSSDHWSPIRARGTLPSPRWNANLVFDSGRDRLLLFGGDSISGSKHVVLNDVWAFSRTDSTWRLVSAQGPRRTQATAFYDPIRDRLVVFGGFDSVGIGHDDLRALSLGPVPTWQILSPAGSRPGARGGAAFAYDPTIDRLTVVGGASAADYSALGATPIRDVWNLDFGQSATPLVICSAPDGAVPGQTIEFQASVTSRLGTPQVMTGTLRDTRGWLGSAAVVLPIPIGALATTHVPWSFTIPDTASGVDTLEFDAFAASVPARSPTCACAVAASPLTASTPSSARVFSLSGFRPNPSAGVARVVFSLPDASPSRLEVFDLSGRVIFADDVGGAAGIHAVAMPRGLRSGLYFLRLRQGARESIMKACLVH